MLSYKTYYLLLAYKNLFHEFLLAIYNYYSAAWKIRWNNFYVSFYLVTILMYCHSCRCDIGYFCERNCKLLSNIAI